MNDDIEAIASRTATAVFKGASLPGTVEHARVAKEIERGIREALKAELEGLKGRFERYRIAEPGTNTETGWTVCVEGMLDVIQECITTLGDGPQSLRKPPLCRVCWSATATKGGLTICQACQDKLQEEPRTT